MSSKIPFESVETKNQVAKEIAASLSTFMENTLDAILVTDSQARIRFWNPAAERMFGWKTGEALGKTCAELFGALISPQDRIEQRIPKIKPGDTIRGEKIACSKEGAKLWVEYTIHAIPGDNRKSPWHVSQYRDITTDKHSDESLRKSEEFFNQAFHVSPNALVISRLEDGRIESVNETFLRFFGYTREEAVGKTSGEMGMVVNPADRDEAVRRLLNDKFVRDLEMDVRLKSGETRMVSLSAEIIGTKEANTMLTTIRDITESKQAEKEQARQAELLERVFENIPVLLVMWDPALQRFTLNHHAQVVLGWTNADANSGDFMSKAYPDADERTEVSNYMQSLKNGFRELHTTAKSGERIPIDWANIRLTDATMIGIGVDLRERKRVEESLRASEERFRTLANAMPSIVWTAAPDGTILFSNENWHKYTGVGPEDNATNWAEFVFHPADYERWIKEWTHALETVPYEYHSEVRYRRYDGKYRWFQTRAIPARSSDGNVTVWYGVMTDIHERVEAVHAMRESQQKLQFLNETLEQKVNEQTAELRRLTASLTKAEQRERNRIAHVLHDDLQQRLYAVKMNLGLLEAEVEEKSNLEKEFIELDKQLAEILKLTRHLTIELSPPVLRDEGLTQAIEWLAFQMDENLGLRIEINAEESFTMADEAIQVLLFNCVRELLFNIVKHAEVSQAVVSLSRSEDRLRIEVGDEGKGFDVYAILEQQEDDSQENQERKASFGLPTLRHQLGLMGGQMHVQSAPGAGTHITITIPFD